MPGPPPNPNARRRNARTTVSLPASGRDGDVPEWPLQDPSVAELALWTDLWRTPQAVMWEKLGWVRVVARYVRLVIAAEDPEAPATIVAEPRHLEDRLGLTPMAMKRLMWEVAEPKVDDAGVTDLNDYRALYG